MTNWLSHFRIKGPKKRPAWIAELVGNKVYTKELGYLSLEFDDHAEVVRVTCKCGDRVVMTDSEWSKAQKPISGIWGCSRCGRSRKSQSADLEAWVLKNRRSFYDDKCVTLDKVPPLLWSTDKKAEKPARFIYRVFYRLKDLKPETKVKPLCGCSVCLNPLHMQEVTTCARKVSVRHLADMISWRKQGASTKQIQARIQSKYGLALSVRTIQRNIKSRDS